MSAFTTTTKGLLNMARSLMAYGEVIREEKRKADGSHVLPSLLGASSVLAGAG